MNRGSALKWVQAMRDTTHHYDDSQLGFQTDDGIWMSPLGVLCEFVDPSGMELNELGYLQWGSEAFSVPVTILKRVKAKTDLWCIYDIMDGLCRTTDQKNRRDLFHEVAAYVEENYAVL